jgi:hypothetical protein
MPTCPRCGTAYLPGEGHKCVWRRSLFPEAAGIVFGGLLGAPAGFFLMAVFAYLFAFKAPGVWVYFVGPGIGILTGVTLGVRAASQADPEGAARPGTSELDEPSSTSSADE